MKLLIVLFFLCLTLQSFSQIYKEQWLIGGDMSFTHIHFATTKVNNLKLSPAIGYFVIDKLATGLRTNALWSTYIDLGKVRSTIFSLAPFIRYYYLPVENKVNLFTDLSYTFGWGKYIFFNRQPDAKYKFNDISLMLGPSFFLNEHTSLEVTLGYSHTNRGTIDSIPTTSLMFGIGLQIHLGKHYKKLPKSNYPSSR